MDDIMVRSRYPRHSIPSRRYKRIIRPEGNLPQTILRQLAVSILILLVAVIVKSINTPATNYISDKIQYTLKQNIEIKSIYEYVDNMVVKFKDGMLQGKTDVKDKDTEKEAPLPVDSGLSNQVDNAVSPESSVLSASIDKTAKVESNMSVPVMGILTSSFGDRVNPATNTLKFHEGIDIEADEGENIVAALDGTVVDAGSSPTYGLYVRIKHADGLETVYAHCSILNVVQGKAVKQGDIIAKVGDSGASVGVHLHFEVWKDGKPVNPLDYISVTK
jgi:murein DD-endopeptidase MepM/ murein hydrolase activator NlpD